MIQRCVRAVARVAHLATLAAVALVLGAGALSAQATAKIEGRVRDASGQPIANAQVFIVGSAFSALTNGQGYYFINNVPTGTISMKAAFVGYQPVQVNSVQVLGGQTMTQDFSLKASVVQVQALEITAEHPLVPRDQVTSKSRIDGQMAEALPVDRVSALLALQPGVVASAGGGTLSIRGGRPSENVTYVDGVPVTPGYRGGGFVGSGGSSLTVNANGLQEANVTTGATNAEFGNAQAGILDFNTRSGGQQFSANLGLSTDQPFAKTSSLGYTQIRGGIGGPIPGVANLTYYASALLEGQETQSTGFDGNVTPLFVPAGIDKTVAVPTKLGDPFADTTYVPVEKFAQYNGDCTQFSGSVNTGIASNYGQKCYGSWRPRTATSNYQLSGKLLYTFGTGNRLTFTVNRSQGQGRSGDVPTILGNMMNPAQQAGFISQDNVFTLNWSQNLSKSADKALALETYLSYQTDRTNGGPMTQQSELSSRDPFGGFMIAPLQFMFNFDNFPLNDQLINNYKNNTQLPGTRISPYDLKNVSQYGGIDQYRNDAYGLLGFSEGGGPTNRISMYSENRIVGRAALDWQADRYNRIKLGGDFTKYDDFFYSMGLTTLIFSDAWHEKPTAAAGFITDRVDLGDVVIDAGLRYDYYSTGAVRPYLLDTASTSATFGQYSYFPRTSTYGVGAGGAITTFGGKPLVEYRQDATHGYLSPHIQVAFPVTQHTNFRLSYAHQVQTPDFGTLLAGVNTDLQLTNTNQVYGNDLGFGKTVTFEFGVRHEFNPDMVLDIAAYNKDKLADAAARLVSLYDPATKATQNIRLMTSSDFGNTKGIDVSLQRRFGNLFTGQLSYTFSDAKNTGSDPYTYINFGSRIVDLLSGGNSAPPQAILPTAQDRTHNLAGIFSLNFPDGWRSGTTAGRVLQNFGVTGTFRYASGTPFTKCSNTTSNAGVIANDNSSSGPCANANDFLSDVNQVRLPAIKTFDAKFTKGFKLGKYDLTAYVDARNLLNFKNVLAVYSATNDVTNGLQEAQNWSSDSADFASEALKNSKYTTGSAAIDLTFGGAGENGCGAWVTAANTPAAPNCVYLIRAEQRFGNGDGTFSVAEQHRASDANYLVGAGLNNFTGSPRRVRVGFEINF
ncbi:MAG TPA: TonB-dependent receptor [Gemmatimonadales bacterium]|nr:TonB-dependent receptor [Gemmatimonadales bacterium]